MRHLNLKRGALRGTVVACAVIALLVVAAVPALADGQGATTFTQTFHNATDSFATPNPCTGAPGTVTITYNGVLHFTVNKAGDFWATGTQTGDFVFVPDDPTQPTYTGHFTTWFGDSDNRQNEVEHSTFTVHGTGSDGSTLQFHDTMHLSVSASGAVVSFDKPRCG
jgi:hypothetical protein